MCDRNKKKHSNANVPRSGIGKFPYPKTILHKALEHATSAETNNGDRDTAIRTVTSIFFPTLPDRDTDTRERREVRTRNQRVLQYIKESNFKAASREMERTSKASLTPAIVAILERLYPQGEAAPTFAVPADLNRETMKVTSAELKEALTDMKESAPGPSRLTVKHLREVIDYHPKILEAFTTVANIILMGEQASEDQRLASFTLARGLALLKDDAPPEDESKTRIRPIGINEVFLNLLARIALSKAGGLIATKLDRLDLGFGTAGGAEAVIHSLQTIFNRQEREGKTFVLIQTDFENAFNSVLRQAIFDAVSEHCPELLFLLNFRYTNLQAHFVSGETDVKISSTAGVSQGCPLSPALF